MTEKIKEAIKEVLSEEIFVSDISDSTLLAQPAFQVLNRRIRLINISMNLSKS